MGRFKHLLRRDEEPEQPCPKCSIPTPHGDVICNACGWDVREAYNAHPGSKVVADELHEVGVPRS